MGKRIDVSSKSRKEKAIYNAGLAGRYTILSLIALFFMFPVIYLILTSFMSDAAADAPKNILPSISDFSVSGYEAFFSNMAFMEGIGNIIGLHFEHFGYFDWGDVLRLWLDQGLFQRAEIHVLANFGHCFLAWHRHIHPFVYHLYQDRVA